MYLRISWANAITVDKESLGYITSNDPLTRSKSLLVHVGSCSTVFSGTLCLKAGATKIENAGSNLPVFLPGHEI